MMGVQPASEIVVVPDTWCATTEKGARHRDWLLARGARVGARGASRAKECLMVSSLRCQRRPWSRQQSVAIQFHVHTQVAIERCILPIELLQSHY